MAGEVSLIHLHNRGVNGGNLLLEHRGDVHRERGNIIVLLVQQRLGQHVGRGHGELHRARPKIFHAFPIGRQVQDAFANLVTHHTRWLRAESGSILRPEDIQFLTGERGVDATHRPDEIINHPIGLRMTDIEPAELTIGNNIDARQFLRLEHRENGIAQIRCRRLRSKPCGNRIAADNGGADTRLRHEGSLAGSRVIVHAEPQWRKWRAPVKTMATSRSSAAAITSSSFTEPPG